MSQLATPIAGDRIPPWRRPSMPFAVARVVLVALLAAGLAFAVAGLLRSERILVTATFDDVGALVPRHHVRAGDVPVGTVHSIEVTEDHRARVTLALDPDAPVPSPVTAVLRQTALLGERYVDLVPEPGATGQLADGGIVATAAEGSIEDLVRSGNTLLAGVGADALANALRVGAATLDGKGATLGGVLDDLGAYTTTLAAGSDQLGRFLDASGRLAGTLAPDAEVVAGSLEDLSDLVDVLLAEEEQLTEAVVDLAGAAEIGTRILREEAASIDALLERLRRVAAEVLRVDEALEKVLFWLPRHNLHVPSGVVSEFSQVAVDMVLCGVNDDPEDPSRACDPPNPGEPNDPAPGYQATACALFHVRCAGVYAYPEGVLPYRGGIEGARVTQAEIDAAIAFAMRTIFYEGQLPRDPSDADPRVAPRPRGTGTGGRP